MAHFDKLERPELQRIEYHITDDHGHTAQLSPEQARELLHWLYAELEEAEETTTRLPTLSQATPPASQQHSSLDAADMQRCMREDWSNDE